LWLNTGEALLDLFLEVQGLADPIEGTGGNMKNQSALRLPAAKVARGLPYILFFSIFQGPSGFSSNFTLKMPFILHHLP
jgi:hypothetical protein